MRTFVLMQPVMNFTPFAFLVLAFVGFNLVGCASKEDDEVDVLSLEKSFVHHDIVIKAWKSPSFTKEGFPKQSVEILVSGPGTKPERWVKLRQHKFFEGLTLESVDIRGDSVGNPKTGLAAVLTEDFSFKITGGSPKPFLVLRDISGYAFALYSDVAHPPFR